MPVNFTIENLLPEGVFLLVASPKVGKSWLALQMFLAVISGGKVLGEKANAGNALYLAFEDGDRRLQSRLLKLNANALPPEAQARGQFETQWPRINAGGAEALDAWLTANPEARLVVADVLEHIRPARDPKANAYSEDYLALKELKRLAEKHRVTILAVHHTRKASAEDAMHLVSGTQGLTGGADGILVLQRARGETQGELHVMARDLEREGAFAVEFTDGAWQMIGPAGQVARTALQRAILEALRSRGEPMKQSEICTEIGRAKATVSQAMKILLRDKLVLCEGGKYRATDAGSAYADPEGVPFSEGEAGDD